MPSAKRTKEPDSWLAEFADDMKNVEDVAEELADIEKQLAERHQIKRRPVRLELVRLVKEGQLEEDELLARWHTLYAMMMELSRGQPMRTHAEKS